MFLLCGLWHGAALTFVVWGAWHGLLLIVERRGLATWLAAMPRPLAQAWTLLAVMVGWVFFRASDMPHAWQYLQTLAGLATYGVAPHPWQMHVAAPQLAALAIGGGLALFRPAGLGPVWARSAFAGGALLLCAASMMSGTYNPFIYFHF